MKPTVPMKGHNTVSQAMRLANDDRGSALLMTLAVLLLMLSIGLAFLFSAMVERDVARNHACSAQAELSSDSGIQRGLAILHKAGDAVTAISFSPLHWPLLAGDPNGTYSLKSKEIDVCIINRTGKIDPALIPEVAARGVPVFADFAAFVATLG